MNTHTFPNGCVVQIDLEAIPDEARWLICWHGDWWAVEHQPVWHPCEFWSVSQNSHADRCSAITLLLDTLPDWSKCIIDLEAVRKRAQAGKCTKCGDAGLVLATALDVYDHDQHAQQDDTLYECDLCRPSDDDGPPRLYDVVERQGKRGWVRFASCFHVKVEIHHQIMRVWHMGECIVIVRNVYDIREAVRLMGET